MRNSVFLYNCLQRLRTALSEFEQKEGEAAAAASGVEGEQRSDKNAGWQFNRIFGPPNRPPKDGRRPKDERLWVGNELGDDLGHDFGGQQILLNCHPGDEGVVAALRAEIAALKIEEESDKRTLARMETQSQGKNAFKTKDVYTVESSYSDTP